MAYNDLMSNRNKRKLLYERFDLDDNFHAQKRYISERIAVELGVLKLEDSPASGIPNEHFHSFNPFLKNITVNTQKSTMSDIETLFTNKFSLEISNHADLMISASEEPLPAVCESQFESEMPDNPGKDEYETPSAGSRVRSGYRRIVHSSSPSREDSNVFMENFLFKDTGDVSMSVLNPYHPSPYSDLPISYPSKALILYRPPEAVLMKSREMRDQDPYHSLKLKIKCILDNGSLVQEEHEKNETTAPRLSIDTLMDDIVSPHHLSAVSSLW